MSNTSPFFSEQQLIEILSHSPLAAAIFVNEDLTIAYINNCMLDIWKKEDKVIGRVLVDVFPELNDQPFISLLKEVLHTGIAYEGKDRPANLMVRGKLQTFYYDFKYQPIKNEKGEVFAILHTATDVTERNLTTLALAKAKQDEDDLKNEKVLNEELLKVKENLSKLNKELEDRVNYRTKELLESEATLRNLILQAPVAIAVLRGKDLIIESANDKILEAWHKTKEIIGLPLKVVFDDIKAHSLFSELANVYESGEPYYGNEISVILNEQELFTNLAYQPIKNSKGKTDSIMLVAHVVTEQVLARKRVEHAEEMLRFSIEAANGGSWFLDLQTRELATSPRYKELYGFHINDTPAYADILAQIPPEYHEKINDELENAIKNGTDYTTEHPIISKTDNQTRWVKSLGKVYSDSTNQPLHFSGLMLDITEQKLDDLRKSDFIGMVSHELKTPLTTLKGYIQLLNARAKQDDDAFRINALAKVETQINKMSELIKSFLDVSRFGAGKIMLTKNRFCLNQLIQDIIEENLFTTPDQAIVLENTNKMEVYADEEKIGVVIANLLSNAIKYSPKGTTIKLGCQLNNGCAEVKLTDEGIGIKANDLHKLFDRYYRVENASTKHISGFGIGLYLSAEIIKQHNGKIWAESEMDKGSTFYFTIPQGITA